MKKLLYLSTFLSTITLFSQDRITGEIFATRSAVRDVRATTFLLPEEVEVIDDLSFSDKLMLPLLRIEINKTITGNPDSIKRFFLVSITRSES